EDGLAYGAVIGPRVEGGQQPREGGFEGVVLARVFLQRLAAEGPFAPPGVERVLQEVAFRDERVDALQQGAGTDGHGVIGLHSGGRFAVGTGVGRRIARRLPTRRGYRPAAAVAPQAAWRRCPQASAPSRPGERTGAAADPRAVELAPRLATQPCGAGGRATAVW